MTMEQIKKDVVVVGGGPGGFAAAVTAARAGAQVLLVSALLWSPVSLSLRA